MSKPTLYAYTVKQRPTPQKPVWKEIGAAFPNKGAGFTLVLDALPLDGKIVLMPPKSGNVPGTAPHFEDEVV